MTRIMTASLAGPSQTYTAIAMLCAVFSLMVIDVRANFTDGTCVSAEDCMLNGDCVDGKCHCDAAWSGAADCSVMAFENIDKNNRPGYYNATESSWGGFPIKGPDGKWYLVHAQMANHCGLGSWTSNSIVAVSTATDVLGPYTFQEELLPHFAHNPTIRMNQDGTFSIFYIGGWASNASSCSIADVNTLYDPDTRQQLYQSGPRAAHLAGASGKVTAYNCSHDAVLDPPTSIRVGSDYLTVQLKADATIRDCVNSCCGDTKCFAFSFNTFSSGAAPICKHKSHLVTPQTGNSCPMVNGQPNCLSGGLPKKPPPPAPPSACNGQDWDKTCGPDMPGPMKDCCGPCGSSYKGNCGCGIAHATANNLLGPYASTPLVIENQWESEDVYCTHTNPSPFYLPNGSIVMAFNAGFCHNHLETIGVAISNNGWKGPWNLLAKDSILKNSDGTPHHCEDPFIWKTARGWHLLTHNQQGPQGESSYAFSSDAVHWTLSPTTPYNCTLSFTDGTSAEASGCGNRPQIFFNADGTPKFIINGAMGAHPLGAKGTYTLFRPIAQ
eukprot:m.143283 g.143283  ORF g.143283 m.143283 type:complete len:552 (-) comp17694_c0_seq2:227-1882(-)